MVAFAFGLLLLLAPPADTSHTIGRCDSLLAEADARFEEWTALVEHWYSMDAETEATMQATIPLYQAARRCYGARRPQSVGTTYYHEAYLHASLRQFPEAFATFDAFFERFQTSPTVSASSFPSSMVPSAVRMYHARAFLHYWLGNLSNSMADYIHAIAVVPDSLSHRKSSLMFSLAVTYQKVEDYSNAELYFDRVEQVLLRADTSRSNIRELLARVYSARADLLVERAESGSYETQLFREALGMLRKSTAIYGDRNTTQSVRQTMVTGVVLGYLGATSEALSRLEAAHRMARQTGDARLRILSRLNQGYIHLLDARWNEAVQHFRAVLPMARDIRDAELERRTLRYLGRAAEMQQNWTEADRHYQQGTEVVERQRTSISSTQWALTAFGTWQDMHRGRVRALLAMNRPRDAFAVLEQTRARYLTDLRVQATLSRELPASKRVRFDSLANELAAVRSRMAKASLSDAEQTQMRMQEASLISERRSLLDVDSTRRPPSLPALQNALQRQNRALVSYFIDDPNPLMRTTSRSHAFVVTPDTLRAVPLSGLTRDSVRALIHGISPLFGSEESAISLNATRFDLEVLHRLYNAVLAPVEPHLAASARPLTIVPDGPLFQLPFSMLVTAPPPNRFAYEHAEYFLQQRPTSVELASSLVADVPPPVDSLSDRTDVAAYGVSRFDSLGTLPSSLRSLLPTYADSARLRLPDLPGVAREIESVRTLFDRTQTALNDRATEAALRRSLSDARILHLASHAVAHPSSPLRNAFLLSDDRDDPSDDGVLFLHELKTEAARIPFVVLSGCSTARGKLWSGEGMQGLQYAFRAMGARSTMSNLWPAADDASVALSQSFYRHLREGAPKDVALQRAQKAYLQNHPDQQSPFFWASTVLYGSPTPLPAAAGASSWWYGVVVIVLAGGALAGYRFRSRLPVPAA
jgi:CHAT domain-containing protein